MQSPRICGCDSNQRDKIAPLKLTFPIDGVKYPWYNSGRLRANRPETRENDTSTTQGVTTMATLAMLFNGMLIKMRGEKNARHHAVHIHAWKDDDNVYVFDVKTRKVTRRTGRFTRDEIIHVQSFIAKHEAELLANWRLLNEENASWFKIVP